jgi:hypothetical protein
MPRFAAFLLCALVVGLVAASTPGTPRAIPLSDEEGA